MTNGEDAVTGSIGCSLSMIRRSSGGTGPEAAQMVRLLGDAQGAR